MDARRVGDQAVAVAVVSTSPRSVGIIVVSYNSASIIDGCLASLVGAVEGVEQSSTVVVDNASTDDTCWRVGRHSTAPRLLRLETNGGYAAGINAGAAMVGSVDALLVMNPDVRLDHGSVATLLDTLTLPATGIAVPLIRDRSGHVDLDLKREPTIMRALGEAVLGGLRAGRFEALGETVVEQARYEAPAVVDWAGGSVMLVSRRCYDELGGWDETFFHGSEEVDFCLRARDHGWLVRYTPAASATHLGGGSEASPLRRLMFANRVELYRRRQGRLRAAGFRTALVVGELLRVGRGAHHRATVVTLLTGRRPVPTCPTSLNA
jgi:GT2 family glycosyltransferase